MARAVQYTIRGIPRDVDRALRQRARQSGKSLNETAIDMLREGLRINGSQRERHEFDDLIGSWVEDPAFEEAMADQDRIDEGMWR